MIGAYIPFQEVFCFMLSNFFSSVIELIDLRFIGITFGLIYYIFNVRRIHRLRILSLATASIKEINEASFDVFHNNAKPIRNKAKGIVSTQLEFLYIYIDLYKYPYSTLIFRNSTKSKRHALSCLSKYQESIELDTDFESEIARPKEVKRSNRDEIMSDIYSASIELVRILEFQRK